jgi:hypothetical protein
VKKKKKRKDFLFLSIFSRYRIKTKFSLCMISIIDRVSTS